jgi:germination protein M
MRKLICILLALMLLLTLSGCTFLKRNGEPAPPQNGDRLPEPTDDLRETVFYLPDPTRQVLVPVRTGIPWEEGIARATVGYLTEGKVPGQLLDLGLLPLLPAGTEIRGITIRDGLARIDFSEEFLKFDPARERLVIYGLVYTLTEFPTINKVEILVDGKKPAVGSGLSQNEPFSRTAGINLEVAESVTDVAEAQRVTLYYLLPLGEQAFYVPVTRVVKAGDDILRTTARELLSGPTAGSPLFTALPQGLNLDDVRVDGSRLTLLLSGDFALSGGQLAADRIWQQLALTFTDIPGVFEIEIRVDGQAPQLPPGIQFPEAFGRPARWNLVPAMR